MASNLRIFHRADRSVLGTWWWTLDWKLLAAFLLLISLGLIMVGTAGSAVASRINLPEHHFLFRHILYLIPALGLFFGLSFLSPRMIWRCGLILFALSLLGMLLVQLMGQEIKGARRWLNIAGFSIQPSEFAKVGFLVVSAWIFTQSRSGGQTFWRALCVPVALYIGLIALLLLQPDIGMSILTSAAFATQLFLAGIPAYAIALLAGMGVIFLFGAYLTFDHVQSRIDRFLGLEAVADTYQTDQALSAITKGGLWGVGPGHGEIKQNLPDAHADFIFAVAAEEMGLFFILLIMGIYGFILWRVWMSIQKQKEIFPVLAGGSLAALIIVQALIHMGSSLRILPAKGMTLPFLSYGGSSLLAMACAGGFLMALTRTGWRAKE